MRKKIIHGPSHPQPHETKHKIQGEDRKVSHQAFWLIRTEVDGQDGKLIQGGFQHSLLLSKPLSSLLEPPKHTGLTTLHKGSTGGK